MVLGKNKYIYESTREEMAVNVSESQYRSREEEASKAVKAIRLGFDGLAYHSRSGSG